MPREYGTQSDLLESIRDRLIDQLGELDDTSCFVSDHPYPATVPHADVLCTVCPGSGTFDQGMFAGSGFHQVNEDATVIVATFVRQIADRSDEAAVLFNDESRGLFRVFKPAILKALLVDDSSGTRVSWEPVKNGFGILRDQLSPLSADFERLATTDGVPWVGLVLRFSANWDWEL